MTDSLLLRPIYMQITKRPAHWLAMLIGLFWTLAAHSANITGNPMGQDPISFEVIADLDSIGRVEAWAQKHGIPLVNQTNQNMQDQRAPELNEAKRFGAIGRLWLTINLRGNSIALNISFFYGKTGGILGRVVTVENIYE